jgi:hypothetical protein
LADHEQAFASAAGDLNGDGIGDLMALEYDTGSPDSSSVLGFRSYLGPFSGDRSWGDFDGVRTFADSNDTAGAVIAEIGDVDADGLDDVALGDPLAGVESDERGAIYVFRGPVAGGYPVDEADAVIQGDPGDYLGERVGRRADLDGDGKADLLVTTRANRASLFAGPPSAVMEMTDARATFEGLGPWFSATEIAGAGDLNGDGLDDAMLANAAYGYDEHSHPVDDGIVYFLFGQGI